MIDPFHSPKRKLARAKQHNATLIAVIDGFFKGGITSEVVWTPRPQFHTRIRFRGAIPSDEICVIAADLMNNLRAVLDQSVSCSVSYTRGSRRNETYFPFGDDTKTLLQRIEKDAKYVDKDIKRVLEQFNPTKHGNPLLWSINRFVNEDKHSLSIEPNIHMYTQKMDQSLLPQAEYDEGGWINLLTTGAGPSGPFRFALCVTIPGLWMEEPLGAFCANAINECENVLNAIEVASLAIGPHQRP